MTIITRRGINLQLEFPTDNISEHQKMLGAKVKSGKEHLLTYPTKSLQELLNKKNLYKIENLLPAFQLELERLKKEENFSSQVKKMILHLSQPALPSLEMVVRSFYMSKRSFQRKLKEEGTSFRTLVNEIKKELFLFLNSGASIKTKDMAYLLGYSEPSAFLHARKNW